jgi:hypothetical protein
MARRGMLVTFVVIAALSGGAVAQIPHSWSLDQNAPEPFCIDENGGGTIIRFTAPAPAHVTLTVWNEGLTSVVRILVDDMLSAGVFEYVWDGRDSSGVWVPPGAYPYAITAAIEGGTEVLFQDTKVAHVYCDTPVSADTWSVIKALYR